MANLVVVVLWILLHIYHRCENSFYRRLEGDFVNDANCVPSFGEPEWPSGEGENAERFAGMT